MRLGWQGQLSNSLTVGAAYSSKINISRFNTDRRLFAGHGDFDIPANHSIGMAGAATSAWTIAAEDLHIVCSKAAAVGNSSRAQAPLGAHNRPGFGWQDVDVVKLGLSYK